MIEYIKKNKGKILATLGAIWAILEVLNIGILTPDQRAKILAILSGAL